MPQRDWDVNAAAVRALPVLEKIQKESGKASLADIIVLAGVVGVESRKRRRFEHSCTVCAGSR